MPLFSRPTEHDIEYAGRTLRMRRATATVGLQRERIARSIVDMARHAQDGEHTTFPVEDMATCLADLARSIQSIDGTPASEILGDDARATLDATLTAAEVIGLWVQWYHASQIDEDLRGKSAE